MMNHFFPQMSGQSQPPGSVNPALQQAPLHNPHFQGSQQNPIQFNHPPHPQVLANTQIPQIPLPAMLSPSNPVAQLGNLVSGNNPNLAQPMPAPGFSNFQHMQNANALATQFGDQGVQQLIAQIALQNLIQSQANPFWSQNLLQSSNQIVGVPQSGQFGFQNFAMNGNCFAPSPCQSLGIAQAQGKIQSSGPNGCLLSQDSTQMKNQYQHVPIGTKTVGQGIINGPVIPTQSTPGNFIGTQHNNSRVHQGSGGVQSFQVSHYKGVENHVSNVRSEDSMSHNFRSDSRGFRGQGAPNTRFHKQQHARSAQGYRKQFRDNGGDHNMQRGKHHLTTSSVPIQEKSKRPLLWFYSPKEIQEWRQARKRNFPTEANIAKKLNKSEKGSEDTDVDAKLRRKQLKEVLAQQAELGVEVAEVPSSFLSDPESQVQVGGNMKKRRWDGRDKRRHSKRKNPGHNESEKPRGPSLLQKLLSSEIKGDRSRLLQAFSFMLTNSFFDRYPGSPLRYPEIQVKDGIGQCEDIGRDGADACDEGAIPEDAQCPSDSSSSDSSTDDEDDDDE